MPQPEREPDFLPAAGEDAWARLRRHLDRANRFWLCFMLTADVHQERILRERADANRRRRGQPFALYRATQPAELVEYAIQLEGGGPPPPGCSWITAPLSASDDWLGAWRGLLYGLNGRRDVLRRRLGGLVIAAPPAVKVLAQRETSDLWSVLDLLIELVPVPVQAEVTPRANDVAPPDPGRERTVGLQLGDAPAEILDRALELLERPPSDLATVARARASRLIMDAARAGAADVAAVVALRQIVGLIDQGDEVAAFDLARTILRYPVNDNTRIALLDVAADLAVSANNLDVAFEYAAESARLQQRKAARVVTPEAQRDLAISLNKVGDVLTALGDPTAALDHYRRSLQIREQLADLVPTPETQRDLSVSLNKVGNVLTALGDPTAAVDHYRRSLQIAEQLADLLPTPRAQRDLSISLDNVGNMLTALGDPTAALDHYRRSLQIAEQLADRALTPETQRDLAISLHSLADALDAIGDNAAARTYRLRAEQLSDSDPPAPATGRAP